MTEHLPALIPTTALLGSVLLTFALMVRPTWVPFIHLLTLIAVATMNLLLLVQTCNNPDILTYSFAGWPAPWGIEFVVDPLSAMIGLLIAFLALAVVVHAYHLFTGASAIAFLLLQFGLQGLTVTGDLFNLFVFIEISALASYALLSTGGDKATFSVLRYLLLGTLGASFYLLGVGFLYAQTGSLNLRDIANIIYSVPPNTITYAGVLLILIGMSIKTAVFPFHGWLPDVYTYAPMRISAFIAGVATKVSALIMLKIIWFLSPSLPGFDIALTTLAILSSIAIIWGSVLAFAQRDIRRMLAYSSIAQVGYITLAIALHSELAVAAAVLHMIFHALMKSCLFLIVDCVLPHSENNNLRRFSGLFTKSPGLAIAFCICGLSMIGLPPFSGFFSKMWLIQACMDSQQFAWLIPIVAGSLLTLAYFTKIIEMMLDSQPFHGAYEISLQKPQIWTIATLTVLIITLGPLLSFHANPLLIPKTQDITTTLIQPLEP